MSTTEPPSGRRSRPLVPSTSRTPPVRWGVARGSEDADEPGDLGRDGRCGVVVVADEEPDGAVEGDDAGVVFGDGFGDLGVDVAAQAELVEAVVEGVAGDDDLDRSGGP